MPTYDRAGRDTLEFVDEIREQYHNDLVEAGVTVGVLFAHPTEREAEEPPPYLKLNGYPAAAVIKINSAVERLQGMADATITIDARTWRDRDEAQRAALIDHELRHLALTFDKDGVLKSDDAGRPKLKMRLHDWQCGGFAVIAQRHGDDAVEVQELRKVLDRYKQQLFNFRDDTAPQDEVPDVGVAISSK